MFVRIMIKVTYFGISSVETLATSGTFGAAFVRKPLWLDRGSWAIVANEKVVSDQVVNNRTPSDVVDRFNLHSSSAQISRAGPYICACLDRSAPFPLDVTLSAPFADINKVLYCSALNPLFNSEDLHHIQRCRSLSWYVNFRDTSVVSALCPTSFERLQCCFFF